MKFSVVLTLGTLAASAAAIPLSQRDHALHERRHTTPSAWTKRNKLGASSKMPMRVGLTQRNLDKGYDLLMEVSKPNSPKYGKHYTSDEVIDLFAPHEDSVAAVKEWLIEAGIPAESISLSTNKQWIQFDAAAEDVESLLKTEYHVYEHGPTGKTNVACDEYHVPTSIQEHVDYITPGVKLFAAGAELKRASVKRSESGKEKRNFKLPSLLTAMPEATKTMLKSHRKNSTAIDCTAAVVPECLFELYNITAGTTATEGNELGIFEDLGDVYDQADLDLFFENVYPTIPTGTSPTLDAIDGAVAPFPEESGGPESLLDFEISYPIIWPQGTVLYQTDDIVYEEDYTYEGFLNNFLDAIDGSYCTYSAYGETGNSDLDPVYPDPARGGYKGDLQCGVYTPTNVISISYGGQEYDLPASYQSRQCDEYMKLGLQGVSVLIASGDSGVGGPKLDDSIDGCLNGGTVFSPDFPASCPYVTAVGGTQITTGTETAVSRFGSGGGFSNIFVTPDYQADAVSTYFSTANITYKYYETSNLTDITSGGVYNRAGRGYPDVAAIGDYVTIYYQGESALIGGTSAASPAFAAVLTRINEERLQAGKSTIGFVNPTLYANPDTLNDIVSGNNPGCKTDGFYAQAGWDPVTGLGTPNYPALLELFLSLD